MCSGLQLPVAIFLRAMSRCLWIGRNNSVPPYHSCPRTAVKSHKRRNQLAWPSPRAGEGRGLLICPDISTLVGAASGVSHA